MQNRIYAHGPEGNVLSAAWNGCDSLRRRTTMDELKFVMNKDGVFELYKEPYMTIEVATEEDFRWLEDAAREKSEREKGCEYCTGDFKTLPTLSDGEAYIAKVTPLPAINLTTGETAVEAGPPFFAIRIQDDMWEELVPTRFCPRCGRELKEKPHGK
jgi:hypothetical protein